MSLIYYRIFGYVVTMALHITNAVVMMSSFHGPVMKNPYVSHFRDMQVYFFTCWTFFFQSVYAGVSLYCDVITLKNSNGSNYQLPKILVDLRDLFFSIIVWPASMLVFTVFWSFYAYDRNLLYPEDIDLAISSASNHIMHTCIAPLALWEVLFRPRTPPGRHKWHLLGVFAVEAAYITTLLGVYIFKGVWVYPIFGILMGSVYFPLFFMGISALLVVIYHSQWVLNDLVWGSKTLKASSQKTPVENFVKWVFGLTMGSNKKMK